MNVEDGEEKHKHITAKYESGKCKPEGNIPKESEGSGKTKEVSIHESIITAKGIKAEAKQGTNTNEKITEGRHSAGPCEVGSDDGAEGRHSAVPCEVGSDDGAEGRHSAAPCEVGSDDGAEGRHSAAPCEVGSDDGAEGHRKCFSTQEFRTENKEVESEVAGLLLEQKFTQNPPNAFENVLTTHQTESENSSRNQGHIFENNLTKTKEVVPNEKVSQNNPMGLSAGMSTGELASNKNASKTDNQREKVVRIDMYIEVAEDSPECTQLKFSKVVSNDDVRGNALCNQEEEGHGCRKGDATVGSVPPNHEHIEGNTNNQLDTEDISSNHNINHENKNVQLKQFRDKEIVSNKLVVETDVKLEDDGTVQEGPVQVQRLKADDESTALVSSPIQVSRMSDISLKISENDKKYSQASIIEHKFTKVPPDGGYGWVIVGAATCMWAMVPSMITCYGLVYAEVKLQCDYTNAQLAGVATVAYALRYLLTPAWSRLSETWGSRPVSVLGMLALSLSLLGSTFCYRNLVAFYFSYGVLQGIGFSMVYPHLTLITQHYFTTKKVTALALAGIGQPVGNMLMPPLLQYLFHTYSVQGTFLIWSGMMLNTAAVALLFHPVQWHMKKELSTVYAEQPHDLPRGGVDLHRRRGSIHMNAFIADEVIAQTGSSSSLTSRSYNKTTFIHPTSSLRKSILPEDKNEQSSSVRSRHTASQLSQVTSDGVSDLKSDAPDVDGTARFVSSSEQRNPSSQSKLRSSKQESNKIHLRKESDLCMDKPSSKLLSDDREPHSSATQPGADKQGSAGSPQPSICSRWTDGLREMMLSYKDILSHKLFIISCLSGSLTRLVFTNFMTFLPLRGDEVDSTGNKVWLLTTVAVSDVITKLVAAAITAKLTTNTRHMYIAGSVLLSLACLGAALARQMAILYLSCVFMGISTAVLMSTSSVLLADVIGMDLLTRGLGLNLFVVGCIGLLIMPFAGVLPDLTGSYRGIYLLLAVGGLLPSLLWSLGYYFVKRIDRRNQIFDLDFPE